MNTKRVISLLAVMAVVLLGIASGAAMSQDDDNMEILRQKIRTEKKLVVARNMQLTDEEGKAFWPVYDAYQKEKGELNRQRLKVIEDYGANFQNLSDEVARDLVDRSIGLQKDAVNLMLSYLPEFRKAVGDKKTALFYQIENKIDAVINFGLASNIPLVQ